MELNARSRLVLQLLVENYIHHARPISSQTLCKAQPKRPQHNGKKLCAASIRTILAQLDAHGLLQQAHKNAGRIPTEKGLRFYLDTLLAPKLRPWDRSRLNALHARKPAAFVSELSHNLALATGQVAWVALPSLWGAQLRELALIRLSAHRILARFLCVDGFVQQRVVTLAEDIDAQTLRALSGALNDVLHGRSLACARRLLCCQLQRAQAAHDARLAQAMRLGQMLLPPPQLDVIVDGDSKALHKSTCADLAKLHHALLALEHKQLMLVVLEQLLEHPGVQVRLGSEHELTNYPRIAYVGCSWSSSSGQTAAVGLFGPIRMDYARVMPLVAHASAVLQHFWEGI